MHKNLSILLLSCFLTLFIIQTQTYAAKFTPTGTGAQFSGSATLDVNISGPRWDLYNRELDNFSASENKSITPSGDEVYREQALIQIYNDVPDSLSYGDVAIAVSALLDASEGLGVNWISAGGGEMGPSVPYLTSTDWMENHANSVSVGSSCETWVRPHQASYHKKSSDSSEENNDVLNSISISASAGDENGTAQYIIEPMLTEQAGDSVELILYVNPTRSDIYNTEEGVSFTTNLNTSYSILLNGNEIALPEEGEVKVAAHIGDIITMSAGTELSSGANGYRIPDSQYNLTSYQLHSARIAKYINASFAPMPGLIYQNPIIESGTPAVLPAVTILEDGPGIDVPVWYRATEGENIEIEVQGAGLAGFVMPGQYSSRRPVSEDGEDDPEGVEAWYDNAGTWVEAEGSPLADGDYITFPEGVTKIQLRGIDRSSSYCSENIFNAGLMFDGASDNITVAISDAPADSNSSITLNVESAWNLVSFNLNPSDKRVGTVFSHIHGKYKSVWAYTDHDWKVYDPENPDFSDLAEVVQGTGYWINMNENAEISISGQTQSINIEFAEGWNLVGYNSTESKNISEAVSSISGNIISVWGYKEGHWQVYDPENPDFSDLTTMEPCYGYWFNISSPCSWEQ